MRPKTKYDHKIVEMSNKLSPLSDTKINWFKKNVLWNFATSHYKKLVCLECNHMWEDDLKDWQREITKTISCPSCSKKLRFVKHEQHLNTEGHGILYDKVGSTAIIRIVYVRKYMYKNKPPEFQVIEVARKFYDFNEKKFKTMHVGMNGMMGAGYQGGWNIYNDLSLKDVHPNDNRIRIGKSVVYPHKKLPLELSRTGFTQGNKAGISNDDLIYALMTDSRAETLFKNKMYSFLDKAVYEHLNDQEWSALKICFRNNYLIPEESSTDYMDYIKLLSYFNKDIRSPKYACPEDLHYAHQKYIKKKRKVDRLILIEEKRKRFIEQAEKMKQEQEKVHVPKV